MKSEELATLTGCRLVGGKDIDIRGFVIDSRQAYKGSVFVALKGERHDGHDFVEDAFSKGAVGAIIERDINLPEGRFYIKTKNSLEVLTRIALEIRNNFRGKVVGVAGSVGKTTTKELIHHFLSICGAAYKSEGNLNSRIGLPLVVANMPLNCRYAVFELGASAVGDVARLTEIVRPQVRVITALGEEHLESFGRLEDVIMGNGEIFSNFGEQDRAVLPVRFLKNYRLPSEKTFTFGEGGDIEAKGIELSLEGTSFYVKGTRYSLPVLSKGIVDNILAAFGAIKALGFEPEDFREVLREFKAPWGRMNLLKFEGFYLIDDTYNANPPSVKNAIDTLGRLRGVHKKVVVLGDMLELGDKSESLHREIGRYLEGKGIDVALFYGKDMVFAYEECRHRGINCKFLGKKEDLLEEMLKYTKDKNIILLKGSRGVKMEQLIFELGELYGYETRQNR